MTKSKNTKRALLISILTMTLSFAMLIGSTFAWFTDSVTSANNKIVAGNLKVALQYSVDGENWNDVDENTNMFKKEGLWEPGYTEVVYLKVVNEGTLALKYQFGINVVKELKGTNVYDEEFQLSDYIQYGIVEVEEAFADRQSAIDAVSSKATAVSKSYSSAEGHLTKGNTSNMLALVVYMPTNVENEANYKKGTKAPEINLGVTLVATQDAVEEDSFNEKYDENAELNFSFVSTVTEFTEAIKAGKNVVLNNDIELPKQIDILNDVVINGNGNTISAPEGGTRIINATTIKEKVSITLNNLNLDAGDAERCISFYDNEGEIDLALDQCTASANQYALNVANLNNKVNLTIKNSEVAAWCAFQTWSEGTKAVFENCTLIGNNKFAYNADGWNDFATIVINTSAANADLTFNNCRFEANQTTGNMQYILSVRAEGAKITINNCTFFADGTEITDEKLGNYIEVYGEAIDLVLTIDGEIIPIQ